MTDLAVLDQATRDVLGAPGWPLWNEGAYYARIGVIPPDQVTGGVPYLARYIRESYWRILAGAGGIK